MSSQEVRPTRVRLQFTQSGRAALMLTFSGLVATAPFGTTLALFPACLLAALALSALVAWFGMRALRLVPPAERVVRTGTRFEFSLQLRHAGWAPGVRDVLVFAGADGPQPSRALASFDHIAAGREASEACEWRTRRRGRRRWIALRVASSFPIGLCEVSALFDAPIDWLSLPRLVRVGVELDDAGRRRRPGALSNRRRGDDEFYALRDARPGDSPHWVHWRSSARRGKLVVRELRGEQTPEKHVVLCGWASTPFRALGTSDAFEHALSAAAAIVERHSRRGELVRFTFDGETRWNLAVTPSRGSVQTLMARLAEVGCAPLPEDGKVLAALRARWSREDVLLVHACSSARAGATRLRLWTSHGAVLERGSRAAGARALGGTK